MVIIKVKICPTFWDNFDNCVYNKFWGVQRKNL